MSVGSRIKEARIRAGITQEQLASELKISKGAVGNYENDTNYPKTEIIFHLCRILNCDPNYIYQDDIKVSSEFKIAIPEQHLLKKYRSLDDHGKTLVDTLLDMEDTRCINPPRQSDLAEYRRYTSPAAAGAPLWAESDYEIILRDPDTVPTGADYAVGISGDSMQPDIPDGATVWVRRTEQVRSGDTVIAWLDGEGTVCKRALCAAGRITRLVSANPRYADISGAQLEGMRVYGVAVGVDGE